MMAAMAGCSDPHGAVRVHETSDSEARRVLERYDWPRRVDDRLGLWVSVGRQRLVGVEGGRVAFEYVCSTAANGVGQAEGSRCTPLGWHEVAERIGDGRPSGAVFRDREFTGEVWSSGSADGRDLILTRILRLRGLESGRNAGPGVDSYDRYIYIHGTPAEERLGRPASAGCIRLSNRDVMAVFERVPSGTPVLITAD